MVKQLPEFIRATVIPRRSKNLNHDTTHFLK